MKYIIKQFMMITVGILTIFSCDYDDTEYDKLTNHAPDPSSTYYVQFKDASKSLLTGVAENGDLIDIETNVLVAIMGLPQSEDVVVDLSVDPSSTATPDMYSLSSTSITIPAGEIAASVGFTAFASELIQNETVSFVLNMNAGGSTAPFGTQLIYNLFRVCALDPETIVGDWTLEMQDSWGDGWNGASITAVIDGVETDYTLDDGLSTSHTVNVPEGSSELMFLFNSGDWDGEVTFQILAPNGNEAGSGGPSPTVGEIILDACTLLN